MEPLTPMTGNKFLLDTNIVIDSLRKNIKITDKVNDLGELFISTVVLGELYIGINRVTNKTKHLKKLTDFLTICTVLDIDSFTSSHYGETIAFLFKKGKPIPTNDVWIAATALQYNLSMMTLASAFLKK